MRSRILFVDDDPLLRSAFAGISQAHPAFDLRIAASGTEGVEFLKSEQFEIVATDFAMPGMNGVELLGHVINLQPQSARILMSGFADQLQFANCLSVAHRYLLKPFDLGDFVQFLEGLARFRSIIQNPKLLRITGALGALPSPPEMYLKLTRLLNSPYSSLTDVAEVLEQDPSLTSKLLQIANSAFYGLGRKVINPSEAVQYLGVEVIRDLVLGVEAFSKWQKNPAVKAVPQSLWDHSLRTALGARRIASTFQNREWADLAFLGGLLHDIGKLVLMLNISDEYADTLSMAERYRVPVVEAEQRRFGANHAQIGAYLLGLWGLPLPVVQLVEHHHSLRSYPDEHLVPLLAVHAAQCLDPIHPREDQLNLDYLRELGYESAIPQWRDLLGAKAANPVA